MMRHRSRPLPQRAARGIAAVEFAIVLPLLAVLLFMVVDLSRAIQAKIILLNISREGANLSARATSDLSGSSQGIMNALAATTPPLDMPARGMIYITKIMGYTAKSGLRNIVLEQYRWDAGAKVSGYLPASQVWRCGRRRGRRRIIGRQSFHCAWWRRRRWTICRPCRRRPSSAWRISSCMRRR